MRSAIRQHLADFAAIVVLFVIAIAVAGYVLHNERLRFPFLQESPFTLKAEMATAQAVVAGQGQTVRVAGVRIGKEQDDRSSGGRTDAALLPAAIAGVDLAAKHLLPGGEVVEHGYYSLRREV